MSSNAAPPPLVDDAAAQAAGESADPLDAPSGDSEAAADSAHAGDRSTADLVELEPVAIDLARAAAVAEAGIAAHVGDFVSAIAEDDIAVTASFVARQAGYEGWQWTVTLAVLGPGAATVSEVVLLPGDGALLAPAWIPWDQRIRPGDVGVGDLLPPIENDPRLVPAYLASDDPAVEAVARELGIGRVHVLSREGRVDFAERLHDGTFGPTGEIALVAPAHCFSCAFYLPLAGSLSQLVGACSNEYSPADGRVVDAGFGCGAHSETVIEMPARSAAALAVIDELSLEVHRRPAPVAIVAETDLMDTAAAELPDVEAVIGAEVEPDSAEPESIEQDSIDQDRIDPVSTEVEVAVEPESTEPVSAEAINLEPASAEPASTEPLNLEQDSTEPDGADQGDDRTPED